MKVADFVADHANVWLFHCHVADHIEEGMFAQMIVHARDAAGGADRPPEAAFLGLPSAARSLNFQRAVALVDLTPCADARYDIHLRGRASVFDAFSIFAQQVRLQLGGKSIVFKPGQAASRKPLAEPSRSKTPVVPVSSMVI